MLSMVIPFYNEEENIDRVVGELVSAFETSKIDYELVLVNNGSTDSSPQLLRAWRSSREKIRVVDVGVNQGYGFGVICGLLAATGEEAGFMCGDGQVKAGDVVKVYRALEYCELAKARRVKREGGFWRAFLSLGYNRIFRAMFKIDSMDIDATPKIFRRAWLETFHLSSRDFFLDAELMLKAKYLNLRVVELPVSPLRREGGKSKVKITAIWEFAKNMLKYKFGTVMRDWECGRF